MSLTFSLGIAIRRQSIPSTTVPPIQLGPPINVTLPVITGTALEGKVLTVSMGTWMGSPTGYSVQWRRGVVAIIGATAASYTLLATDVGSTISATVTATNANGSTPTTSVSTAAIAAAGAEPIVVGLMGQSEIQYPIGAAITWDALPNALRPIITSPNMVMINAKFDTDDGLETEYQIIPVTTATVSPLATRNVSAGIGALSAALQYITPGTQFAVVDLAKSGTGRTELMTDVPLVNSETGEPTRGRDWAQFAGMIQFARNNGYDLDEVHEAWYANDSSSIPNFLQSFGRFYMGENGDGTPANIGNMIGAPSGFQTQKTLDHMLWDITGADRGIFDINRTKLRVYLMDESRPQPTESTAGMLEFLGDSRVQTFAHAEPENHWVMGARNGGHAVSEDQDGAVYSLFNYVPGFLKAAGMAVGKPHILAANTPPGGAYTDITVSLPNGGNLTTIRALEGRAAPAAPTDDYQPVMGLEVQRFGEAIGSKLAFVPTSKTAYAAKYRGSVAIIDTGTGTGAQRTGKVRITPEVPFASGDQLHYLSTIATTLIGGGNERRITHKTWLDALIETVPAWRDTSAPTRFPGIMVAPLLAPVTLDASAVSANPLGTPVILNGTNGTGWSTAVLAHETTAFTPSGTDAIYVVAVIGDNSATSATGALVSSCTIGNAGRAAGTGTSLTLVSDTKRNRARIAVYRLDGAPSATSQTVEMGFAASAPLGMRILVLQVPNASLGAPVSINAYNQSLATTSWTHNPIVSSANNGVLYIHALVVSSTTAAITSASDSTLIFNGYNGLSGANGTNSVMLRWDVPGATGEQAETFNFPGNSSNWRGLAVEIKPRP